MFRTPKVGTRALAGIATIATVTGLCLPLMATAASAAVNTVTIDPASPTQSAVNSTANVLADISRTAGDTTAIRFAVTAGPDADKLGNGTLVADGTCTPAGGAQVPCAVANGGTAGTDTIRVFADTNGDSIAQSTEPSADTTVTFYGLAFAVDLKPDSDSAAAGTCNAFTATVTDQGGRTVPNQAVKINANLTGNPTTGRTLTLCDPGTTNPTSTNAGGGATSTEAAPATGTVTTDSTGKATFGIESDQPGTATVQAYVDNNGTAGFQAGEPTDTSTKTFTAGGGAGSQAANDAVTSLTPSQTTVNSFAGQPNPVQVTITAKNSNGDTVPNAVILAQVTGTNAGATVTCTTTNNSGVATCSYTPAANKGAGTDTITFWVNQTQGGTSGPDANEPKTTVTNTIAAAPSGNTINLTCTGTSANANDHACVDPTTDSTEVFTALVSKGVDANNKPIGVAGIRVDFTVTSTNNPSGATVNPTSAVTDGSGIAKTTLTDTNHTNNTVDTVTATIAGQSTPQAGGHNADSATKTFETAAAKTLDLQPDLATTQIGTASTFVATVKDQFGAPVVGGNVNFTFDPGSRNTSLNGTGVDRPTDASGKATFTYTDVAGNSVNTTDSIRATLDANNNGINDPAELSGTLTDVSTNKFINEPATAGSVDLDVTNNGACGSTGDPADDTLSGASVTPATTVRTVCAVAKTAGGVLLAGKTVTFTLSGVGNFVSQDGKTVLTSPQTATTNAQGVATVYVQSTKSGAQNLTATIDGKSDTGTITYASPAVADARNIDLKPDTSTLNNGNNQLTALVTDRFGNPVSGIQVDFTENGPGQFSNGTSSISATTGPTGTVTVTFQSGAGTTGTDVVTATIGTTGTSCALLAGNPAGTTTNGNCSDSSTYTLKDQATGKTPTISVGSHVINIGKGGTGVGASGTPGHVVWIYAYSRPSTTYVAVRKSTFDANGQASFTVSPRTNTRIFAKDMTSNLSSASTVISVHPALSLVGSARGKVGSFSGGYVPGQANAAIRIFTVKNGVRSASPVGTATTDSNGHWTYSRSFAASGPVTFIVQSLANLTNASGQGNRVTITFS